MFSRPIAFALFLNCALATLICGEARGQIMMGDDYVPVSTAFFTMTINPPFGPGTPQSSMLVSTPFYIHRQAENTFTQTIDTEIDDLTFTGNSAAFGPIRVRVGDNNVNGVVQQNPTLGQIQNVISTGPNASDFVFGNSFFDVFFEVDVAGLTLYNRVPHHLEAPAITELPPDDSLHLPGGLPPFVNLYWRQGLVNSLSDPLVGTAIGSHQLSPPPFVPEPASLGLFALGCIGLASRRRRQR